MYRTCPEHQPTIAEYAFFSRVHRAFSEIDQVLKHKRNLNKFNKIEIIQGIFSNQSGIKQVINSRNKIENLQICEI